MTAASTHVSPEGGLLGTTDVRSLHALDFAVIDLGERYVVSGFGQVDDMLGATTRIVERGGRPSASLGATAVRSWS